MERKGKRKSFTKKKRVNTDAKLNENLTDMKCLLRRLQCSTSVDLNFDIQEINCQKELKEKNKRSKTTNITSSSDCNTRRSTRNRFKNSLKLKKSRKDKIDIRNKQNSLSSSALSTNVKGKCKIDSPSKESSDENLIAMKCLLHTLQCSTSIDLNFDIQEINCQKELKENNERDKTTNITLSSDYNIRRSTRNKLKNSLKLQKSRKDKTDRSKQNRLFNSTLLANIKDKCKIPSTSEENSEHKESKISKRNDGLKDTKLDLKIAAQVSPFFQWKKYSSHYRLRNFDDKFTASRKNFKKNVRKRLLKVQKSIDKNNKRNKLMKFKYNLIGRNMGRIGRNMVSINPEDCEITSYQEYNNFDSETALTDRAIKIECAPDFNTVASCSPDFTVSRILNDDNLVCNSKERINGFVLVDSSKISNVYNTIHPLRSLITSGQFCNMEISNTFDDSKNTAASHEVDDCCKSSTSYNTFSTLENTNSETLTTSGQFCSMEISNAFDNSKKATASHELDDYTKCSTSYNTFSTSENTNSETSSQSIKMEVPDAYLHENMNEQIDKSSYPCCICSVAFPKIKLLAHHLLTVHDESDNIDSVSGLSSISSSSNVDCKNFIVSDNLNIQYN